MTSQFVVFANDCISNDNNGNGEAKLIVNLTQLQHQNKWTCRDLFLAKRVNLIMLFTGSIQIHFIQFKKSEGLLGALSDFPNNVSTSLSVGSRSCTWKMWASTAPIEFPPCYATASQTVIIINLFKDVQPRFSQPCDSEILQVIKT